MRVHARRATLELRIREGDSRHAGAEFIEILRLNYKLALPHAQRVATCDESSIGSRTCVYCCCANVRAFRRVLSGLINFGVSEDNAERVGSGWIYFMQMSFSFTGDRSITSRADANQYVFGVRSVDVPFD